MDPLQKKNRLILIVDDRPKNIQVIGTILRRDDFNVSIATSGHKAIKIIEKKRPDLILLDVIMPDMDGFETCRRLKDNSATKDIPVIFLSALSDTVDKVKGFNAGAVDFVTKPVEPEELLSRINTHLNFQSLHRELEHINLTLEEKVLHRTQELEKKNEALQESEERYRMLVETMNEGIIIVDPDRKILYANSRFGEMLGYSSDEMIGRHTQEFLDEADSLIMEEQLNRRKEGIHDAYEIVWRRRDGRNVPTMMSPRPIFDNDGRFQGSFALVTDITNRKRAEKRLQRFRNLLSSIINSMPSVLVGVDREGRVFQWNREAEKATGLNAVEAEGRSLVKVFPQLGSEMKKVREAIKIGRSLKDVNVQTNVNGEIHFSDITVYPLAGIGVEEGAVIRIDDVTERVRIEELMVQSEKMMSLGGLAAGMAHEINNPLSGMLQAAQNALRRTSPDQELNVKTARECGTDLEAICLYLEKRGLFSFLGEIRSLGIRASRIVANMLQFSRPSEPKMVSRSLPELMDRAIELASIDYDLKKQYDFKHIEILREYDPGLPEVPCVETEIIQVLLNLLRNAAEAMVDQDGKIEDSKIILRARQDGSIVRLEVEDDGPGMDEIVRKRVFEPFFTTKAVGNGTGLGLSVSYFIITNNHHGRMRVVGGEDEGTTFIIELPVDRKTSFAQL